MSDVITQELKRVIDRLKDEQMDLQSQIEKIEHAIATLEDVIGKMSHNKSAPTRFSSVGEAVRYVFKVNFDKVFTSIDVSNALKEMIDKGQLKLKKDQNLKRLVHSNLYTLSDKKGYIQKRPSDDPLVNHEYVKPFVLGEL